MKKQMTKAAALMAAAILLTSCGANESAANSTASMPETTTSTAETTTTVQSNAETTAPVSETTSAAQETESTAPETTEIGAASEIDTEALKKIAKPIIDRCIEIYDGEMYGSLADLESADTKNEVTETFTYIYHSLKDDSIKSLEDIKARFAETLCGEAYENAVESAMGDSFACYKVFDGKVYGFELGRGAAFGKFDWDTLEILNAEENSFTVSVMHEQYGMKAPYCFLFRNEGSGWRICKLSNSIE